LIIDEKLIGLDCSLDASDFGKCPKADLLAQLVDVCC